MPLTFTTNRNSPVSFQNFDPASFDPLATPVEIGISYLSVDQTRLAFDGFIDADGVPTSILNVFKRDNGLAETFPSALYTYYELDDVTSTIADAAAVGGILDVSWVRGASGGYPEVFGSVGQVFVHGTGDVTSGQACGVGMEVFVESPVKRAYGGRGYVQVDAPVDQAFGWNCFIAVNDAVSKAGAIQITAPNGGSNVTNLYGILIEDITGGITASYAIYTGAGKVHLGSSIEITGAALVNAANDGAAASGGVAVGQMYRNGSVLMIRVS